MKKCDENAEKRLKIEAVRRFENRSDEIVVVYLDCGRRGSRRVFFVVRPVDRHSSCAFDTVTRK